MWDLCLICLHFAIPLYTYRDYPMIQCESGRLRFCSVTSCTWETNRVECPDRINRGKLAAAEWESYGMMTTSRKIKANRCQKSAMQGMWAHEGFRPCERMVEIDVSRQDPV